jgi:hypothetical protein
MASHNTNNLWSTVEASRVIEYDVNDWVADDGMNNPA